MTEGSNSRYYLYNGHGDTVQLANNSGTVEEDYTYDAFGNQQNDTGHTIYNPFRYCGEYTDAETGLIYLRNRYYDPSTGRFITEDPAHDGLNWYVYCDNNPVMLVDPMGLFDYNTQLSYNPNKYNPDVKVLQNELAYLGYLSKNDRDGYFGEKTLNAVNKYKDDMGLWNFDKYNGVVGLTTWQHLGLPYREQIDIDAGVKLITVGCTQYFDISKPVNDALYNAKSEFAQHELEVGWFIDHVKNNGEWNIKADAERWSNTLGISKNSYDRQLLFYGRPLVIDDIGNITYGYLGKAAGFPDLVLKGGSFGYHILNHGVSKFNNEFIDEGYVQLGINWYNGANIQLRYEQR